ncbi:Tumor necrosis factor receptor superfamily member 25 [Sciurus carolinensis]|uniref:Tumor necrosis factor receptor superfamily member 25 n=1 Tax=Sciurus carolinensis TaxID=30640 RepID=A0AA41STX3_SCICA|nr:Tumor necrosis factor receptor superfamily member 25 [Sciurus carolinensis]
MLGPLKWRSLGKEGPPHGTTTILQAVLLLLGIPGQGSIPGPRCDCTSDFQRRNGPSCCRGCPVGHYMKTRCTEPCGNSTCLPCPQGTFLARDNHFKDQCTRCQACDEEAFQVALENCSAVADTRCGCKPGWLIDCSVKPCRESSPFRCRPCSGCEAMYTELPLFWAQVLMASLVVLFLLGATLIYTYRRCQTRTPVVPAEKAGTEALTPPQATHLSSCESAHTLLVPPGSSGKVCTVQLVGNSWTPDAPQAQEVPSEQMPQSWAQQPGRELGPPLALPLSPVPNAGSPAAVLQPGPQLYDVMDAVPARRWKEFVRTLGLREAEIEAVEVEIGRFRDQQYEMLKRWRQQQPAGLGAVYAALERMGLDGCAEDLRSRLQQRGS